MVLYDDKAPGVYVQEVAGGAQPIQAVGTSTAGFLGVAPLVTAHVLQPFAITNWMQFTKEFCPGETEASTNLARAVYGFFQNSGSRCYVVNLGEESLESGLAQLARIDDVTNIAAPGYTSAEDYNALITHCEKLADRVAILDAPSDVTDIDRLKVAGSSPAPSFTVPAEDPGANVPEGVSATKDDKDLILEGTGNPGDTVKLLDADQKEIKTTKVRVRDKKWVLKIPFPKVDERIFIAQISAAGVKPPQSAYAAFYFPWILVRDPLLPRDDPASRLYTPPSGHIPVYGHVRMPVAACTKHQPTK